MESKLKFWLRHDTISPFLLEQDVSQLQAQLPWLCGTFGTISLDSFIFYQVRWITSGTDVCILPTLFHSNKLSGYDILPTCAYISLQAVTYNRASRKKAEGTPLLAEAA